MAAVSATKECELINTTIHKAVKGVILVDKAAEDVGDVEAVEAIEGLR